MNDLISRQAAIDALRYAQHRFTVADEAGGMGTVKWSEDVIYFAAAERVLAELPSAQPELSDEESELIYRIGYEKGKLDGVKYCTERLKKMNDSFCGADMRGEQDG